MRDKIKQIEELFSNFDNLTPESVEKIVSETLKIFTDVMSKLNSSDEKERTEALQLATELRTILESKAKEAMKSIGMDEEELTAFMSNPEHFSPTEWQALGQAKEEMQSFQENLKEKGLIPNNESKDKAKKNKSKIQWVQG